jgi:hypothetical protein
VDCPGLLFVAVKKSIRGTVEIIVDRDISATIRQPGVQEKEKRDSRRGTYRAAPYSGNQKVSERSAVVRES